MGHIVTICSDPSPHPDVGVVHRIQHWIVHPSPAQVVEDEDQSEEGKSKDDGQHDPVTQRSPPLGCRLHDRSPPPDEPVCRSSPLVFVFLTVRVPSSQQGRLGQVRQIRKVAPVPSPHGLAAVEAEDGVGPLPGGFLGHQLVRQTERIRGDVLSLRGRSGPRGSLDWFPLQIV